VSQLRREREKNDYLINKFKTKNNKSIIDILNIYSLYSKQLSSFQLNFFFQSFYWIYFQVFHEYINFMF